MPGRRQKTLRRVENSAALETGKNLLEKEREEKDRKEKSAKALEEHAKQFSE